MHTLLPPSVSSKAEPARGAFVQRSSPRRSGGHVIIPAPEALPGQAMMVGLGDWDTYLMLDRLCEKQGMRVRFHGGIIELVSLCFHHEWLKAQIRQFVCAFCNEHEIDYNAWGSTT